MVLTCLREANEPMNYKDLMMKVLDIKGIDSSVGNDISPSFIKVLNRLRDKGIIIAHSNHRPHLWGIAD